PASRPAERTKLRRLTGREGRDFIKVSSPSNSAWRRHSDRGRAPRVRIVSAPSVTGAVGSVNECFRSRGLVPACLDVARWAVVSRALLMRWPYATSSSPVAFPLEVGCGRRDSALFTSSPTRLSVAITTGYTAGEEPVVGRTWMADDRAAGA